jgi:hypothetical protein
MFRRTKLALGVSALMVCLTPAAAVASSQLGDASPAGNTGSGCGNCSFFQKLDSGGDTYVAATPGVITGYGVHEGTTVSGTNNVSVQIWRDAGGGGWTLVNESAPHNLWGGGFGLVDVHDARMTIAPGDRIGMRVNYGANTSTAEAAAAGNTLAGILGSPTVGSTVPAGSIGTFGSLRANIYATVELDGDGDGFGDESQDLCVGDPAHGDTACSGTLIGPRLTDHMDVASSCSAISCVLFPTAAPGGLATNPVNGVIVRWRIKANPGSTAFRLRVVQPLPAGEVRGVRTGPTLVNTATGVVLTRSEELHIPIAAGETIGMQAPNLADIMQHTNPGAATAEHDTGLADGDVGGIAITWPRDGMFNADVEPDADADGFGDVTQDLCPTDATTQATCPVIAAPQENARISGLNISPKTFRAKSGTTLSFNLSLASKVKFVVAKASKGRLKGKKCLIPTAKNRKLKRCTRYTTRDTFVRNNLSAGANSFKYKKPLKPGTYRLTATPDATTGTPAVSATTTFKVVLK